MKVTPVNKPFGKYKVGETFEFPSKAAKVYIKIGKLAEVVEQPVRVTPYISPEMAEMQALIDATEDESKALEVEISERTGKPKRVYRRRDMEAE